MAFRKHGKLLEEGASGFLAGKFPVGNDDSIQCHEKSWSSFNELIKSKERAENTFGSGNWESVYLASTPQEAAKLGLQFPGVDEVPFYYFSSEIPVPLTLLFYRTINYIWILEISFYLVSSILRFHNCIIHSII
jgi:hypothetical protein